MHPDIARIVFAVDERCAVSLLDVGKLTQRNLLAIRRAHQQIADVVRAAAELRLHAHHQVEEFFSLNDLRGGLSAHGRLHHGLHVGHIDAVAGDFVAVDIDQQAGLAEFAHHRQLGETRAPCASAFLIWMALSCSTFRSVAIDLHGQRALQAGERLIHRIFGRLRVVEDDAGKGLQLLVDGGDQFLLGADVCHSTPCPCKASGRHRTRS